MVKVHRVTVVQHKPGWPSFGPNGERSVKININKLRRVEKGYTCAFLTVNEPCGA